MNAWNKIEPDRDTIIVLRNLFFRREPMQSIISKVGLTERVIRRIINERRWTEKRKRYWQMLCRLAYKNQESITSIAKRCGIRETILYRVKREMGLDTQRFDIANKRLTPDIESMMILDYSKGKSSVEVAKKHGFANHKTVLDVLSRHGVQRRSTAKPTDYNIDYFEAIDSHDKAYILGLLLTDGYVIKNYTGIAIQLTREDGYLLERIAEILGPSATIANIDCSSKRKVFSNAKDMIRLNAHCPKMAQDLKQFGMVKNKTKILECPKINTEFLSSFCRGLWDGDGTIGIDKRGYIWCHLSTGSATFAQSFSRFPCEHSFNIRKPTPNHVNWTISPKGGQSDTIEFLSWMYASKGNLYLERKYDGIKDKIN